MSDLVTKRVETLVHRTCEAFGATATVDIKGDYPAVVNHATETAHVKEVGREVLGEDNVSGEGLPMAGAEVSFSCFQFSLGPFDPCSHVGPCLVLVSELCHSCSL